LERTLEPEYMDTRREADEYDAMDHGGPNEAFVERLVALGAAGRTLDLGTGPGHIPVLVCARIATARVTAIDAAATMLDHARRRRGASRHARRIALVRADAKCLPFSDSCFDTVYSNTILHHIPEPRDLLAEVARVLVPGGTLLVRDLFRPATPERALELVRLHCAGENEMQRELFRASLHAALTPDELSVLAAGCGLAAEVVIDSDRHMSLQSARTR